LGTGTVYVILGKSHTFHGGMIPDKILIFWENSVPAWTEYGARREPPHIPENPEFKHIITNMLLRFAMEYSRARDKLKDLKKKLEEIYGASFKQFMANLDQESVENKEYMNILNKMRKTMESHKLDVEALIICYYGWIAKKIEANLKRLKLNYKLVTLT